MFLARNSLGCGCEGAGLAPRAVAWLWLAGDGGIGGWGSCQTRLWALRHGRVGGCWGPGPGAHS